MLLFSPFLYSLTELRSPPDRIPSVLGIRNAPYLSPCRYPRTSPTWSIFPPFPFYGRSSCFGLLNKSLLSDHRTNLHRSEPNNVFFRLFLIEPFISPSNFPPRFRILLYTSARFRSPLSSGYSVLAADDIFSPHRLLQINACLFLAAWLVLAIPSLLACLLLLSLSSGRFFCALVFYLCPQ